MSNVLLLRSPIQEPTDRYEAAFLFAGYHPISVPVLETVHINLDALERIVQAEPISKNYGGVILTSKRSCDALGAALQSMKDLPSDYRTGLALRTFLEAWSSVPFYVVGQGTGSALSELAESYASIGFKPTNIRGEDAGTGERLARFIVEDYSTRDNKLFYLTGDKNRDTIPKILKEGGVDFQSLQVYNTQGSSHFESNLENAIASAVSKDWWIAYFAPSAAEFVTPILRKHFDLRAYQPPSDSSQNGHPKVAAIGPVTLKFLHDTLNLHVEVVPPQPTPEDLVDAISIHDHK
ncbi:tetrapyrrole biosynthesis, uroporphyrinogen III synthase [Crucibulum laeve]|uniref:Tetrapyrrole biosynthesis, uroporphyrinogen III synthase n=1 Tax=Crucibulum laeve TaxID=68775 RepID=A0A5C3LXW1_9AGAR|nr:tetrapyrrole biosynthesis, uroporphyrinogen III synthase [Crucibulum laeve]